MAIMNLWKSILTLALVFSLAVMAAYAKEGGDQYPNGSESWSAGATPPPGFYYLNYFGYYTGQLKDGSGNNVHLGGASGPTPMVNATFDAFRFLEVTKVKILGANYEMHVIVPLVYQSMNFGGRNDKFSVGDITIDPFILGWHRPTWHAVTGIDIYLPTGNYSKTDARVSVGANYYSFEPILGFSYMPKSGWEASTKLMYNLKTTNNSTNYHSGQDFHMDYLAGKHIGPWLLGASGYLLKQATDDTLNGVTVPAYAGVYDTGRRGQVLAIGPSAGYNNKRHMSFIVQWQHETLVRNRFGGDKMWFKAIIPIASLRGKPTK
jgi:hypothetical protein